MFYGDDPTDLGRRLRAHLDAAHGVPADPTELAALALPVAGVRPGESTARTVADATE